ncbi:MAG: TonB-dependent receptor domain-containing protein [Hyphomicrobiales bacterium]
MKVFYTLIIVSILYIPATLFAQSQKSIQLIDKTTNEPIVNASFTYGKDFGLSDINGIIYLQYKENEVLKFSHISYGQWSLDSQQLKEAITVGKIYKKPALVALAPVTIVTLRNPHNPSNKVDVQYQDRLSHDVSMLLEEVPSLNLIRKSGSSSLDPVLRGFKNDQLNIVIDGIQSATVACPNRMDPPTSQVSPNMTKEVEVYKGPYSFRYGNAIGGTINFISISPKFSEKFTPYGRWSGGYETNGNIYRTEGLAGFSNKYNDLAVFGSYSKGSDYEDGNNNKIPARFSRYSYGADYSLKLSDQHVMVASFTHNYAKDVDFPTLPMDLRKDDAWLFKLQHQYKSNSGTDELRSWKTVVFGTFIDHLMDNRLKVMPKRMVYAETSANTENYGIRTEAKLMKQKSITYMGADYRVESARGTRIRDFISGPMKDKVFYDNVWQDAIISKTGAFAEYHLNTGSFKWMFSGRLDLNYSNARKIAPEFSKVYAKEKMFQANPNVSAGSVWSFAKHQTLALWLGRAQRSGNITEKYINYFPVGLDPYELIGNPDISPEKNNQVDLIYTYKTETNMIKLDLFVSLVNDYISSEIVDGLKPRLPTSPGVRKFVNIDNALLTGFEFVWLQKIISTINHQISIAYTYGEDESRKDPLPEIAPLDIRYTISGEFFTKKFIPQLRFRYVADQKRISAIYGERTSPSFFTVDLELSYQLLKRMYLSGGIRNITDKAYYEHLNRSVRGTDRPIYAPGRSAFFSISIDL